MTLPKEVEPLKNTRDINKVKQYLYGKKNKRDYCIFVVGINVGLRAGDLLSLKISDVTDGNKIFDEVTVKEQKTGKTRTFTLNKSAKEAIQLYLDTFSNYDLNNYLFQSRKGGHLGVRPLHHIIKTITKDLGIKGNYGTHTLRKTMAYHRYINNVPLETLQKLLNHPVIINKYNVMNIVDGEKGLWVIDSNGNSIIENRYNSIKVELKITAVSDEEKTEKIIPIPNNIFEIGKVSAIEDWI